LYDGREKKFKRITVDDYLPADGGKPIFANPNGSELWVLLLEKAMAKLFGSYGKLDGGTPLTRFTRKKVQ
jgi:calpain-15